MTRLGAAVLLALPLHCAVAVECADGWGRRGRPAPVAPARLRRANCGSLAQLALTSPAVFEPIASRVSGLVVRFEQRGPAASGLRLIDVEALTSRPDDAVSPALQALIDDVAGVYAQDARLLRAMIHVESRFNPDAVSPKGAIGLMQVMPATAERLGLRDAKKALFDPTANLHAGASYLRSLMNMFSGRPELAVAAYNAGEAAVIRYGRSIPPYPETQAYVRQVMDRYRVLCEPRR